MTGDRGFSIVESAVSIAVVSIVMTAVTSFFVINTRVGREQNDTDVAVNLAIGALSRVHSIRGSSLPYGRDVAASHLQWNSPAPGVAAYQADSVETWDPTAPAGSGSTALLPTDPITTTVGSLTYSQNFYVGQCWQSGATGACGPAAGPGDVPMFRVIVAITWADPAACPAALCSYVTATLVSSAAADPVFLLSG